MASMSMRVRIARKGQVSLGAVELMAVREVRRRVRGVVALALLVAVVGTVVLSTTAGARRTRTALDRFRAENLSADLEMATNPPTPEQVDRLRAIDGVTAIGVLDAPGIQIPLAPELQSVGVVVDDAFGVVIDRERIVAGRAPDPTAPNEIAIGEGLADKLDLGVGDELDARSFTPEQIATILAGNADAGDYAGPDIRLQIVGISRRPLDLGLRGGAGGFLVLTPAFGAAYRDQIGQYGSRIRIRTEHGAADVDTVEARAREVLGDSTFSTQGLAVEVEGARDAIDVLVVAMLMLAAVTAVAGAAAIGFVATREVTLASREQLTLRALGLTRLQRGLAAGAPALVAIAVGSAVAVAGAVIVSPLFPFGVARRADPDVGVHADWLVIAIGTAASLVVLAALVMLVASRAAAFAATTSKAASSQPRASRLAEAVSAAGLSPALSNGLRMALVSGRGRVATPVRSACAAAIVGLAGASAVLVFAASLSHLVDSPRHFGWTWDFATLDITSNSPCDGDDFGLREVETVESLAEVCYQNVLLQGRPVIALAFRPIDGPTIAPEVIEGRAPQFPDEIAVGSTTMRESGVHIGETVTLQGRTAAHDYRIVGRVVFPTLGQPQPLADGVALTGEGYEPIYDQNLFSRYLVGTFADGGDRRAAGAQIAASPRLTDASGPIVPGEIDRLDQIDWFPASLAFLIGGLALYAVAHALVTSVRRRRAELAVLKTLGFSRGQVRATIAWQATTLAAVGVVIGIPLGLFIGIQVWRRVADSLGVALITRVPGVALAALIPLALLLVNLIAFLPARAAARLRPAAALRSE
jgi:hypothetical protein